MKTPRIDKHGPASNGREGGDNEGRSESRGYDGGGPLGSAPGAESGVGDIDERRPHD